MRYLVDRGTGTIVPINGDLVIVDVEHDQFDSENILCRADKSKLWDKAVIGTVNDLPMDISDLGIANELNDYVSYWGYVNVEIDETDSYGYCLANPDTWPVIRAAILHNRNLWDICSDTFANAVIDAARNHDGVAE